MDNPSEELHFCFAIGEAQGYWRFRSARESERLDVAAGAAHAPVRERACLEAWIGVTGLPLR
ncbi:MAG: hypothetical protein JO372_25210 [Solirubrobacterales bacterium]|nr:hypothetical protein [Solirubrobacterales bacterium]